MTRLTKRRLVFASIAAVMIILVGAILGSVRLFSPELGQMLAVFVIPLTALLLIVIFLWCLPFANPAQRGICGKCGYDLTGNTSGVCPECGTRINPP